MDRGKGKLSEGPGSSIQAVQHGIDSVSKSSTPSVDGPSQDFLPTAESPSRHEPPPPFSFNQKSRLGGPGTSVAPADVEALAATNQHILAGRGDPKKASGSVQDWREAEEGGQAKRQKLEAPAGGQVADREPSTPDQPVASEVSIGESPLVLGDRQESSRRHAKKIIIDTDPGIDDAFAILLALQSPELEVVALTTIFGNVRTPLATSNALHLVRRPRSC